MDGEELVPVVKTNKWWLIEVGLMDRTKLWKVLNQPQIQVEQPDVPILYGPS